MRAANVHFSYDIHSIGMPTLYYWGQVYFLADLVCLWQFRDKSGMLLGSWHPVFLFCCDKHNTATARQRVNSGRQETGLAIPLPIGCRSARVTA